MKMRMNCIVLCGGDGQEREVSLRSGAAVCAALNDAGLNAETLDLKCFADVDKIKEKFSNKEFNIAFIAMHGDWGEGGRLQEWLENAKIPYTGSDSRSSALAMDKWKTRELCMKSGFRVPKGILIDKSKLNIDFDAVISEFANTGIVVKPCSGGSTVGVSIIKNITQNALNQALNLAAQSYDSDILIEEYIAGRELTVAVWERNGKAEALPVIEIVPKAGFYDYKNKYTAGATEYLVPAPLDDEIAALVSAEAVKAHKILGCRAYSRVDFRLTPEKIPYLLEINTTPGMTATSLVPKAANAAGISMSEFVSHIVEGAEARLTEPEAV